MKQIKINYWRSPKLVGAKQYEMDTACFSEEMTIDLNGESDEEIKTIKDKYQSILENSVNLNTKRWEDTHKLDLSGVRIRLVDGVQSPSVTSILGVEGTFKFDPQYGERGQEIENIVFDFIDTGKWREPAKALQTISYSDIKYKEFFQTHSDRLDFKDCERKIEVASKDWRYSGEIDIICKVDGLLTLADFKCGQWNWAQLVAYHFTKQVEVKQLAIFDLKNNKLEILKLTEPKYAKALLDFIYKRGFFKAVYGI